MTDAVAKPNDPNKGIDLGNVNVLVQGGIKVFKTTVHITFSKQTGDKTTAIVYNDDMGENAPAVSLADLQAQIQDMFKELLNRDQKVTLDIPWPDSVKDKIKKLESQILIGLNVVYLKITKFQKQVAGGNEDPTKTDSLEYAFWISIKVDKDILNQFPIAIENLSLKLWSPNLDNRVKEKMNITEIQALLGPPKETE